MELDKLVFVKVLDNDAEEKKINVLMKNQAGENVIVRLFQPAFTSATIDQLIQRGIDRQQLILQNTKFSQWSTGLSSEFARLKMDVINPATEKDIKKYSQEKVYSAVETAEFYKSTIEPFINSIPKSETEWVDNIIEGKAEQDKVIISTSDFVTAPDMKWDAVASPRNVYAVSFAKRSDLRSLRDLRGGDVAFLKEWKEKNAEAIKEKFGVDKSELLFLFHYYPSFYHLHLHIISLSLATSRLNVIASRAHPLDDVIAALESDPNYFEKCDIAVIVQNNVIDVYRKAGLINE